MRKILSNIAFLVFAAMFVASLASCSSDSKGAKGEKKAKVTAKAKSAPYELLVVASKDWLKTPGGEMFMKVVNPMIEGLPSDETSFRVTSINPSAFQKRFRSYGLIVKVDVDAKHEKAMAMFLNDVYCQPQVIIQFEAPSYDALLAYLASDEKTVETVQAVMNEHEFARERALLAKHYSNEVMKASKEMFGKGVNAPKDIDQVKRGKNFFWASASKQDFRLNACVYALPLRDMSVPELIAARDSVMKVNIPGSRDDQWMETDTRTVTARMARHEGKMLMEIRGLWDMRNDAMGGPFVSYVQTDYDNDRLLVAEGFVFAPEEKKRALIRELEAMLQTMIL